MAVQKWSDDTLVVRLGDDPALSDDMEEIADRLGDGCCDVVLDLEEVSLLTSSGIARLLRLRTGQIESEKRLILCRPSDRVWGVLLAMGLDGQFEMAETVSEALTRIQGSKT